MHFKNNYLRIMLVLFTGLSFTIAKEVYSESLFKALKYRNIGPFRGGRSAAVGGIPGNKFVAYFGGTGGGVWQTKNAATTRVKDGNVFFIAIWEIPMGKLYKYTNRINMKS